MTNKHLFLLLLLAACLRASVSAAANAPDNGPRVVVTIVIDQLRTDYLETFEPFYAEKGFRRLLREGAVYANASYPFTPVDRASAIAAVASGTTPYFNSIVGRQWLSRETLRPVSCVDDDRHHGVGTSESTSPAELCVSTTTDELKMATDGQALVYAIAAERDAAVMAAGHAADGAFWIDDMTGEWCSSQYYFKKMPKWLKSYNQSYAPALKVEGSDEQRFRRFKQSRQSNAEVTNLARQCIVSTQMGTDQTPDMLCLTYQAGLPSAPLSKLDAQDIYLHLDYELGQLVDYTEKWFGKENVLFVLTGTGYSIEAEPDYEKYRIPTGSFFMDRTAGLLNMYFGAIWGQDKYVEATYANQIFLNHKLLDAKKIKLSDATAQAQELLAMMTGVKNVYTSLQLLLTQNGHLQEMRQGFNPTRCGDLFVEVAPGWRILREDGGQKPSARSCPTAFPVIFYGAGITPQNSRQPVTADRIAPTLSRILAIPAPNACTAEPL